MEAVSLDLSTLLKEIILDLDQYDHIVFISQNAVEFGLPLLESYWPQWPVSLAWYAVGPATALKLKLAGIVSLVPEPASSEGLLRLPELVGSIGAVLIVRGVGGRELLKETLIDRGATVTYLEVYRRLPVRYDKDFAQCLQGETIALVYSGEVIARLAELVADYPRIELIVPSKRLLTVAIKIGFDKVRLASNQQDESMHEALRVGSAKINSG
jgi:uroporphyrinogen-III synthase